MMELSLPSQRGALRGRGRTIDFAVCAQDAWLCLRHARSARAGAHAPLHSVHCAVCTHRRAEELKMKSRLKFKSKHLKHISREFYVVRYVCMYVQYIHTYRYLSF